MIEVSGAAVPTLIGGEYLTKRVEQRSIIEHLGVDGSVVNLNGLWEHNTLPQAMWRVMVASGDAAPVSFRADTRTFWDWGTALGAVSKRLIWRPLLNGLHSWGFADVFPATAGNALPFGITRASAIVISAWVRKKAAGDVTDAKRGIAFGSNIVMAPSRGVPMCGFFGDGAQGYRFGSINCPDGTAAGEIAQNQIDANSVQPPELVSPGVAWMHVRLKMIPPTVATTGRIACYLNGQLVVTYTTLTNLPRGGGGVSAGREFSAVEPGVYCYGDAARAITGFLTWDIRVSLMDDFSV
jgi:hypothetical protein